MNDSDGGRTQLLRNRLTHVHALNNLICSIYNNLIRHIIIRAAFYHDHVGVSRFLTVNAPVSVAVIQLRLWLRTSGVRSCSWPLNLVHGRKCYVVQWMVA